MCKTVCEGGYTGLPIVVATFLKGQSTILPEWYLIPEGASQKYRTGEKSKRDLLLTGTELEAFRTQVLILETFHNTLHMFKSN